MTNNRTEQSQHIGKRIANARADLQMSQAMLAEKMRDCGATNWHPTTVTRIENGSTLLRAIDALDVARILKVDLMSLLTGSWEPSYKRGYKDAMNFSGAVMRRASSQLQDEAKWLHE